MKKYVLMCFLCSLLLIGISCQSDDSDILDDEIPITKTTQQNEQITKNLDTNQTSSTPQAKYVKRQFNFDMKTAHLYRYQIGAIICIFVYLIMYRTGKAKNYELMETFYKKIKNFVDTNFSHIGFTKNSGEDPFVAQSANDAMFYASGRNNVEYLQIKFNMLKRQDMLYHLIYQSIYPQKDTITIDIATEINLPIVFCIANKKKLKTITENNIDLAKLTGTFDVKGLSNNYHALSQAAEILDTLIDGNICKKINDFSSLIHSIHFTDQKLFSQAQGHLRAIFYLSQKNVQKYLPAIEMLFQLVDKIKDMKVTSNYKTKAFKSRESFNASIQKQKLQKHKEDLRKKKQQKRKQQEAWLRSLPAQKQKKEDDKRKKKQLNKMLKSRVMKVA